MAWLIIAEEEQCLLEGWRHWLATESDYNADKVFEALCQADGYAFPRRYPRPEEKRAYLHAFGLAIAHRPEKR